jgi:PKD repeat protein
MELLGTTYRANSPDNLIANLVYQKTKALAEKIKIASGSGNVLLIGHSQGALYIESALAYLMKGGIEDGYAKFPIEKIAILNIASPAFSNIPGEYINSGNDRILYQGLSVQSFLTGLSWESYLRPSNYGFCYSPCENGHTLDNSELEKLIDDKTFHWISTYLNENIYFSQIKISAPKLISQRIKEKLIGLNFEKLPNPTVDFSVDISAPIAGQEIKFTPHASSPNGDISSYSWTLGVPGAAFTSRYPDIGRMTYDSAGDYIVNLTVTDSVGKSSIYSRTITVAPQIKASTITSFPNTTAQVGIQKTFTIIGTDLPNEGLVVNVEGCTNFAYTANSSLAHTFTCTFNQAKTYPVAITTKISPTPLGTFNITVGYAALPVVAFTISPQNPKVDEYVTYTVTQASSQNGNIVSYEWYGGIGTPATFTDGDPKVFKYTTPGTYTVKLTVKDSKGASSSVTNQVIVSSATVAQPSISAFGYPISATTNTSLLFDISGQNLPTSPLTIFAPGCTNFSYLAQTATKHTFYCTYTNAGAYQMTISTAGTSLGSYTVNIANQNIPHGLASADWWSGFTPNITNQGIFNDLSKINFKSGYGLDDYTAVRANFWSTAIDISGLIIEWDISRTCSSSFSMPVLVNNTSSGYLHFDGSSIFYRTGSGSSGASKTPIPGAGHYLVKISKTDSSSYIWNVNFPTATTVYNSGILKENGTILSKSEAGNFGVITFVSMFFAGTNQNVNCGIKNLSIKLAGDTVY